MSIKLTKSSFHVFIFSLVILSVSVVRRMNRHPLALIEEPHKIYGLLSAPITITEFSDFACPYCRTMQPVLYKLVQLFPQALRIQYKHLPLKMHRHASLAAEASECAADQGRFFDYAHILFEHPVQWNESEQPNREFVHYAAELLLDMPAFAQCVDSKIKSAIVKDNEREADAYLVSGTPTLILNAKQIITQDDEPSLIALVEKQKKILEAEKK